VCLPLAYEALLVGLLRLRCRPGQSLSADQIEFLNSVAPELARALALSIAYPQQMAQARTQAQQAERRQIAYELHDTLAQHLGYLHLSLDRLANDDRLRPFGGLLQELERMRQTANEAYEIIRDNLTALRVWQAIDLNEALSSYANTFARQTGLKIDLTTTGTPVSLSLPVNRQVFSLAQEGLNNVEKHAQAQRVAIALHWSADSLQISLTDDGRGFDPQAAPAEGRYGLVMLRERVAALRGEMEVESAPGRGATLRFRIPLGHSATPP